MNKVKTILPNGLIYKSLFIGLVVISCSPAVTPLPATCGTDEDLAKVVADCRDKVHKDCDMDSKGKPVESCPTLIECDKRINAWQECK